MTDAGIAEIPSPGAAGPYAVIADVHANASALQTVLEHLDGIGVKTIHCLGDTVGYGQGAVYCLQAVRERCSACVQGNHDAQVRPPRDPKMRPQAQVGLDLALQQLAEEDLEWLAALPPERSLPGIGAVLVHGSLTGRDDYILDGLALAENEARMMMRPEKLLFFGHTHVAFVRGEGHNRMNFNGTTSVTLAPDEKYLVNPGSVGQPRDNNPETSFAVVYPEERRLDIVRLPYDIPAEQARMRRARLSEKSWKRLAVGR